MHIITKYYNYSANILKEFLPSIPKLKLSDAKSYFGKITKQGDEYTYIALSKYNLDCGNWNWWDDEDIIELIDTISHEFAHMFYWDHDDKHKELTDKFNKIIINSLSNIKELI